MTHDIEMGKTSNLKDRENLTSCQKIKTFETTITYSPATKFSFIHEGKLHIGYLNRPFHEDLEEETLNDFVKKANFVEMGYHSNVVFILPKIGYDSSNETKTGENNEA